MKERPEFLYFYLNRKEDYDDLYNLMLEARTVGYEAHLKEIIVFDRIAGLISGLTAKVSQTHGPTITERARRTNKTLRDLK